MTHCSNDSATNNKDFSTQILGETGGTVVYVFADGNARVKKGKKVALETHLESRGDRLASTPASPKTQRHKNPQQTQAHRPAPASFIKPPPPPPLKPESSKQKALVQPPILPQGLQHASAASIPISKQSVPPSKSALPSLSQPSLTEYLLRKNLINAVQIEVAQYDSRASGLSLEEVLLARGWVTSAAIAEFHQMAR